MNTLFDDLHNPLLSDMVGEECNLFFYHFNGKRYETRAASPSQARVQLHKTYPDVCFLGETLRWGFGPVVPQ